MTLGRTSSGAIKLKTDEAGGGLRAVECACCAPPPDWQFRLGIIKVEASFERSRCATWDGLSESVGFFPFECSDGGECIGEYPDPTPFDCVLEEMWSELSTCGSSPAINKWTKEVTISEAPTTMTWCAIPSSIEECSAEPGNTGYGFGLDSCPYTDPQSATYGIDYAKTWTEKGYTVTHGDEGGNKSSHAQSICEAIPVGGGETALNKTGSLYAFYCSFYPCGKTAGEFSISENSFTIPATYYKDGICHDAQDAQSWYNACYALPIKTTQPATVTYTFDNETSSAFISSAMGAMPEFPIYSAASVCEVGLSQSAESSYYVEAIMPPSSATEECPATNLVSKVSGKKTKFKIIHNVSPTKYLKVWIKRGKIDINTGDFSESSVEEYEIDEQDFQNNPQSATDPGCTTYYSNEYTLNLQFGGYESADDWVNNGGIGRADEYAYILKYSFVADYEPPTTGTGINERCDGPCNGYPPTPPTP